MIQKTINMKRAYEKPSMKVYELKQKSMLLAGSNPDYWGYTPEGTKGPGPIVPLLT